MKVEVWLGHPSTTVLARGLLAVLFLAASVGKIRDPCGFASAVVAYRLLPRRWVRPFAYTLPRVEVILGLMLVLGWKTRIVAALCGLLLFSFTLAMGINLARGRTDLDCGCFGERHRQKIGNRTLPTPSVLLRAAPQDLPKGQRVILYNTRGNELGLLDVEKGTRFPFVELEGKGGLNFVRASPTGDSIAFELTESAPLPRKQEFSLWRLDLQSHDEGAQAPDPADGQAQHNRLAWAYTLPVWSPQGDRIALLHSHPFRHQVGLQPVPRRGWVIDLGRRHCQRYPDETGRWLRLGCAGGQGLAEPHESYLSEILPRVIIAQGARSWVNCECSVTPLCSGR